MYLVQASKPAGLSEHDLIRAELNSVNQERLKFRIGPNPSLLILDRAMFFTVKTSRREREGSFSTKQELGAVSTCSAGYRFTNR